MPPTVLTDAERLVRPLEYRARFCYWLDFHTRLTANVVFRRWFETLEARDAYILTLPKHAIVDRIGEEN